MRLRVRTVVAMSGAQRDSQRRGRLGLRLFHAALAFFAGSTRLAAVDTFLVRASGLYLLTDICTGSVLSCEYVR